MKSDDLRSLYERETGWVSHYWMGVGKHRSEYARQEYTAWLERRAAMAGELAEALAQIAKGMGNLSLEQMGPDGVSGPNDGKMRAIYLQAYVETARAALAAWGEVAGEKGRGT